VVIGITGALYGGLGVGQAVQNAMATLWAVPRNDRPDPLRSRLRSVLLLLVLGSALIATTVLSAVSRASESFGFIAKAALVVAAVLINAGVCGRVSGRDSPGRDVPAGDARRTGGGDRVAAAAVVRGGLRGAHRQVGQRHQQRVRPGSRVAGLPVPDATTLLLCAEANVVATDHLYLRALLTSFTRRRRVNGPHRHDCRFPESRFPLAWTYFRESATSDATPRARSSRNTASRQALTVAPQRNCAM
jgi:membrane protein